MSKIKLKRLLEEATVTLGQISGVGNQGNPVYKESLKKELENQSKKIRNLISQNEDINFADEVGKSVVHFAVVAEDYSLMKLMLERGVFQHHNVLNEAAKLSNPLMLSWLIVKIRGDKIAIAKEENDFKEKGVTAAFHAAEIGNINTLRTLVLHGAEYRSFAEKVKSNLLITKFFNDIDRLTSLEKQFTGFVYEIISYLDDRIKMQNVPPQSMAAMQEVITINFGMIVKLAQQWRKNLEPEIAQSQIDSMTRQLLTDVESGFIETGLRLLQHKINVSANGRKTHSDYANEYFAAAQEIMRNVIVPLIDECGANPSVKAKASIFQYAILFSDLAMQEQLVSKGADVNATDIFGRNCQEYAEAARIFVNPSIYDDTEIVVDLSGLENLEDSIPQLIEEGQIFQIYEKLRQDPYLVHRRYENGKTILHLILENEALVDSENDFLEVIFQTIRNKEDFSISSDLLNAKDANGNSPLHILAKRKAERDFPMLRAFLLAGADAETVLDAEGNNVKSLLSLEGNFSLEQLMKLNYEQLTTLNPPLTFDQMALRSIAMSEKWRNESEETAVLRGLIFNLEQLWNNSDAMEKLSEDLTQRKQHLQNTQSDSNQSAKDELDKIQNFIQNKTAIYDQVIQENIADIVTLASRCSQKIEDSTALNHVISALVARAITKFNQLENLDSGNHLPVIKDIIQIQKVMDLVQILVEKRGPDLEFDSSPKGKLREDYLNFFRLRKSETAEQNVAVKPEQNVEVKPKQNVEEKLDQQTAPPKILTAEEAQKKWQDALLSLKKKNVEPFLEAVVLPNLSAEKIALDLPKINDLRDINIAKKILVSSQLIKKLAPVSEEDRKVLIKSLRDNFSRQIRGEINEFENKLTKAANEFENALTKTTKEDLPKKTIKKKSVETEEEKELRKIKREKAAAEEAEKLAAQEKQKEDWRRKDEEKIQRLIAKKLEARKRAEDVEISADENFSAQTSIPTESTILNDNLSELTSDSPVSSLVRKSAREDKQQMHDFLHGLHRIQTYQDLPQFLHPAIEECFGKNYLIYVKGSVITPSKRTPADLDLEVLIPDIGLWSETAIVGFVKQNFDLDLPAEKIYKKFDAQGNLSVFSINIKDEERDLDLSIYDSNRMPPMRLQWNTNQDYKIFFDPKQQHEAVFVGISQFFGAGFQEYENQAKPYLFINGDSHGWVFRLAHKIAAGELTEGSVIDALNAQLLSPLKFFCKECRLDKTMNAAQVSQVIRDKTAKFYDGHKSSIEEKYAVIVALKSMIELSDKIDTFRTREDLLQYSAILSTVDSMKKDLEEKLPRPPNFAEIVPLTAINLARGKSKDANHKNKEFSRL